MNYIIQDRESRRDRYNSDIQSDQSQKERFAWTGLGVPLGWLAELDNVPAPHALADAFGDRYLYRHCQVFRSVRDAAVSLGCTFSSEDTPLWRDYASFSLMALPRILSDRAIPYLDTGTTFRRLADRNPGLRLAPGFIVSSMHANHVFHESAHCVAHAILKGMGDEMAAVTEGPRGRAVLESILAECFANTVEVVGSVFEHMPLSDSVFYPLNSYFRPDKKVQDTFERALSELGAARRFAVLFSAYFESNLTTEKPTDAVYARIAEAGECAEGEGSVSREITDTAFRLSIGFREQTTPAYFGLLGCAEEYRALANAEWLRQPCNQEFMKMALGKLWATAGRV